jgi:hypothetical protein
MPGVEVALDEATQAVELLLRLVNQITAAQHGHLRAYPLGEPA